MSTQDEVGVHVLGYNFDLNNQELIDTLFKLRNARRIYLYDVAKKLEELGYIVNVKELEKIDSVTKAHIATNIIENNKNEKLLIKTFGHIPNKGGFIETIMNEGCPAYVKKTKISFNEAANVIRKAGGKVVMAHPVGYKYEDNLETEDVQRLLDKLNPDGIEAYYLYVDRNNNKIDEINKWKAFAKKNNKFVTVGSDFHKKNGLSPVIGFVNWDIDISNEEIEKIINSILV